MAMSNSYSNQPDLDKHVRARLMRVVRRLRMLVTLDAIMRMAAMMLVLSVISFAMDYGSHGLRWSMRFAYGAAALAIVLFIAWRRLLKPLRLKMGPAEAAHLVERSYPQLSSVLISAVRFSSGEMPQRSSNSPALMRSVIDKATAAVSGLDFDVVVNRQHAHRVSIRLIVLVALSASALFLAPEVVGMWFERNVLLQKTPWPQRTHLVVELDGEVLFGAIGDDLIIQAHAEGDPPREVEFHYETISGKRGREMMVTVGSASAYRYRYTFKDAKENFQFSLRGGDDRTRWYEAKLEERPHVAASEIQVDPPAYSLQALVTHGDGQRHIEVLQGSQVTLAVMASKSLAEISLVNGDGPVSQTESADDSWSRVTFSPKETDTYHFQMRDQVGLDNKRPVRFSIRVIEDEPPFVRVRIPGVGDMVTREAILPIAVECRDTYGLATLELFYRVDDETAEEMPVSLPEFVPARKQFLTTMNWPILASEAVEGDRLFLGAHASDFNDVTGPGTSDATVVTLRIVSRDELLAELSRREQEYRLDFQRIVHSQERLRGDLLTVARQARGELDNAQLAQLLSPLERRQRNLARSVNIVRQQFQQILDELRINQLDTKDEVERLAGSIIAPLTSLATRDLIDAADEIRRWSRQSQGQVDRSIDKNQEVILRKMQSILDGMIQWEGYHELVNMLRDIMRLQNELHTETKDSLDKRGDDVFED